MRAGNFRDLGGLAAADGRRVRPRTLFRSEALTTLDPPTRAELAEIPVVLMFDLRSTREGEPQNALWAEGSRPEMVHIALFPLARVNNPDTITEALSDRSTAAARRYMADLYRDMVEIFPERCLAEFAHRVGGRRQVPVLVHCTAGQDRTGMLVALVLLALGVPRETVTADYSRSLEHFGPDRMLEWAQGVIGAGDDVVVASEAVAAMGAQREYLDMALDLILERHGSFDAYWAEAGVDDAGLARMRDVLLAS